MRTGVGKSYDRPVNRGVAGYRTPYDEARSDPVWERDVALAQLALRKATGRMKANYANHNSYAARSGQTFVMVRDMCWQLQRTGRPATPKQRQVLLDQSGLDVLPAPRGPQLDLGPLPLKPPTRRPEQ